MVKRATMSDDEFERRFNKLSAFAHAHPEWKDALAMWQVDRGLCELTYPEATEVFERELDEF